MNLTKYQQQAERTIGDACSNNIKLGLVGEMGEIADHIKKAKYHGHEFAAEKLAEELGDLLWYVAAFATHKGINLKFDTAVEEATRKLYRGDGTELEHLVLEMFLRVAALVEHPFLIPNEKEFVRSLFFRVVLWIELMGDRIGVTLDEVAEQNIAKLKKRYPNGFESSKSINREE